MIKVHNAASERFVAIDKDFICRFMPDASGEYVKVYLYLLFASSVKTGEITADTIADACVVDKHIVLDAISYWNECGIIKAELLDDDVGEVTLLDVHGADGLPQVSVSKTVFDDENSDARMLLIAAEHYLKRTLKHTDARNLLYLLNELHLPVDVCDFLVEYCVATGHTSIHYIRKVGQNWYDDGITTVEDAKERGVKWAKYYYEVLKAFGIKGRDPVTVEVQYMERWKKEYKFPIEMIRLACARAVDKANKLEYADRILTNWKEKNAYTLEAVKKLEEEYGTYYAPVKTDSAESEKETFNKVMTAQMEVRKENEHGEQIRKVVPGITEVERQIAELRMKKVEAITKGKEPDSSLDKEIEKLLQKKQELIEIANNGLD